MKDKKLQIVLEKINELDPKCQDHNLSEIYNLIIKLQKGK